MYPLVLSILTNIILAAGSVLYETHPFVKLEEILYSHFQSSLLKKKLLQHGLSCASTGDIFDESTVEVYVKTDFENFSWVVQQAENRLLSISSFSFWFFH